jgi:hypothetical protein
MRRWRGRIFAVGGLAAGAAAGVAAIVAALGASTTQTVSQAEAADVTITHHSVSFGHDSVGVQTRPGGLLCFTVNRGSSTVARSCTHPVGRGQIEYASSRWAIGGLAGRDVRAVIVRLTRKGTVWAQLRNGAFYARIPDGYGVRAVVKVLRDGSRTTFVAARRG